MRLIAGAHAVFAMTHLSSPGCECHDDARDGRQPARDRWLFGAEWI